MIFRNFVFYFLFILVIVSKEILVFNEEILVLFSFIIFFLIFQNYVFAILSFELNLRSNRIKEELYFYQQVLKKTLTHMVSYYNKQKFLNERIRLVLLIVDKNISYIFFSSISLHLKLLAFDIDNKLKKLAFNESKMTNLVQIRISFAINKKLLIIYNKMTKKIKKRIRKFLLNSISYLLLLNVK